MKIKQLLNRVKPGAIIIPAAIACGSVHASAEEKRTPYCEGMYSHVMQMHAIYLKQILIPQERERDRAAVVAEYLSNPALTPYHKSTLYRF